MADADRRGASGGALRTILREPLLHFALIGLAVFAASALLSEPEPREASRGVIVVDEASVANLAARFAQTWRRPPTPDELIGLVADHVREEVYVREALELGLDGNDTVIRRRLRQKMEFLAEGAQQEAPGDAVLKAHWEAHPDRFSREPRLTFQQVFLGEGDEAGGPEAALAALRDGADPGGMGRASLLPRTMTSSPSRAVDAAFGTGFAEDLAALPEGGWTGPVSSAFGDHLVRIERRVPGGPLPYDEVRDLVAQDWLRDAAVEQAATRYKALRAKYEVVLPEGLPPEAGAAR